MLTPRSSRPRHILPALRTLPSYTIPASLVIPTVLYSTLPNAISLGAPIFFKTRLNLDPDLTPTSFNFFSFLAQTTRLFVQLPLETVLRRAQIDVTKPERTIVPVGRYAGVAGTAWVVVKEEENSQWAFDGLYRGWRIGMWSNMGAFGLQLLGLHHGSMDEF
jgi:fusion and transport protein UGO1